MKPRNASDETEILGKLVSDRDLGFTMLVRKYQPAVYSGALRLTHRHSDAEEVAQDTFLRAYRALVGYDRERISKMKLQPWLWTIALNLCRDRASSRTTVPAPEIDLATTDEQPLDTEAWNRRLSALSDDQRLAVVL
ncbi:MAG: RNA polymerase sigma factor, partial [Actinomycetota bacterium]